MWRSGSNCAWAAASLAAAGAVALSAALVLRRYRAAKRPTEVHGIVKELWIYPIKSCRGISVPEADCTNVGLQCGKLKDRHWLVATEDKGIFVTQRQMPKMTLISVAVVGDTLHVDAPGMKPLVLNIDGPAMSDATVKTLRVWDDEVPGLCCGEEAAEWFSEFLGMRVRLFFSHHALNRRGISEAKSHRDGRRPRKDAAVAYADGYPYLLANERSLAELNQRLQQHVSMPCFRANIVIDGPAAFEEDSFRSVSIGDEVVLYHEKPCTRCLIPTIDLATGEKDANRQPLVTLKTYRMLPKVSTTSPCFAINLVLDKQGRIKVGDRICAQAVAF